MYAIRSYYDPELAKGLNIVDGKVTYKGVAEAFNLKYEPFTSVL